MGDIRCGNCGRVVLAKARYCPICGASSDFFSRKEIPAQTDVREPAIQPVAKEVYREKEIIREVVKVRCRHCGTLFEERLSKCLNCGAPG